jgi:transposase
VHSKLRKLSTRFAPWGCNRENGLTHGEVFNTLVINRLISPTPLYMVEEWARKTALKDVVGINPCKLEDSRIGRTLDAIVPHHDCDSSAQDEENKVLAIQAQLALNAITGYKLYPNIVHYDITAIFFEGEYKDEELIVFGYTRDRRPDAKQINLGLNTLHDGAVPVAHDIYKRSTADVSTVVLNMQKLRKIIRSNELIVVSDRGTVSAENIVSLREAEPLRW